MLDTQKLRSLTLEQLNPVVTDLLSRLDTGLTPDQLFTTLSRSSYNPNFDVPSLAQRSLSEEINGSNRILRGSASSDFLTGNEKNDALYGLAGDDILFGDRADDQLNGGTGRDLIIGGEGNNRFIDDDGGDLLVGGQGTDQFWIEAWNPPDTPTTIANFQAGTDKIKIRRLGATFDALEFQDTGEDVTILNQGRAIATLLNVNSTDLTTNSFIFGAPELANQLQAGLERSLPESGAPGIANAVVTPDGSTWKSAVGFSNLEQQTPLQSDDVFSIASITKAFTGATVLKVVEAGKLSLDDTLGKWLPDIANNISGRKDITLRQLLNGTSGIPNFDETARYQADLVSDLQDNKVDTVLTAEQAISYVYDQPRFSGMRTSTTWTYTNTADIIAGLIVEKATGLPFATVMRQEVLDPLGLKRTFFGGKEELPSNVVNGYRDFALANGTPGQDGVPEDLTQVSNAVLSNFGAAGALFSTSEDVARFTQSLFSGELLSTGSLTQLTTFVDTNYSPFPQYGFGVIQFKGTDQVPTQWLLTGDAFGYKSDAVYFPDRSGTTFVALANRQSFFEASPKVTTASVVSENFSTLRGELLA
jgi:D-alanyl-D-alanine carboxypeptidase